MPGDDKTSSPVHNQLHKKGNPKPPTNPNPEIVRLHPRYVETSKRWKLKAAYQVPEPLLYSPHTHNTYSHQKYPNLYLPTLICHVSFLLLAFFLTSPLPRPLPLLLLSYFVFSRGSISRSCGLCPGHPPHVASVV